VINAERILESSLDGLKGELRKPLASEIEVSGVHKTLRSAPGSGAARGGGGMRSAALRLVLERVAETTCCDGYL
jgi:hypothetical protein